VWSVVNRSNHCGILATIIAAAVLSWCIAQRINGTDRVYGQAFAGVAIWKRSQLILITIIPVKCARFIVVVVDYSSGMLLKTGWKKGTNIRRPNGVIEYCLFHSVLNQQGFEFSIYFSALSLTSLKTICC